jgi:hypothetical protein
MFHCGHSGQYTRLALDTFFRHTPLDAGDRMVVLDTGGDFQASHPCVEVLPAIGQTFAQNVNTLLSRAWQERTAVYCLNNDLLFASGWREALEQAGDVIACPIHSHNLRLGIGGAAIPESFDLAFYGKHRQAFDEFAAAASQTYRNPVRRHVWLPSFSCFRLTPEVIRRVGLFDERFRNAGEDVDYALRAHLRGVPCVVCENAFVFHFAGKSTWSPDPGAGACSMPRTSPEHTVRVFTEKWGPTLAARMLYRTFIGAEGVERADQEILACLDLDGIQANPAEHGPYLVPR